ncbi:hypothetical protein SESBI_33072 [Sesbania bispinosa]|nr:hypothetical protein SESBI_33072 [Sesbania bispinosa]
MAPLAASAPPSSSSHGRLGTSLLPLSHSISLRRTVPLSCNGHCRGGLRHKKTEGHGGLAAGRRGGGATAAAGWRDGGYGY